MIKFDEKERPLGVQIFGDNPEVVGKSAKYIYENFKPDIIDINFGCPSKKVVNKYAGSAIMQDEDLARSIMHAEARPALAAGLSATRSSV